MRVHLHADANTVHYAPKSLCRREHSKHLFVCDISNDTRTGQQAPVI